MSSISASGGGQSLSQFLQSISGTASSSAAKATGPTDPNSSTSSASSLAGGKVAGRHHRHGGGHGGLFGKIQQSVTDALKSAPTDGSADSNQVVEDAIAKALQSSTAGASQASGGQPPADGSAPTDAAGNTAQSSAPAGGDSARQAFLQTLKSYGIDPQQFHQDFLSAVNSAKNGQADPSAAFKSFPPGLSVDTTA